MIADQQAPELVPSIEIPPRTHEPYLVYEHWYETGKTVLTRGDWMTRGFILGAAWASSFAAALAVLGLWGVLVWLVVLVVALPLNYRSYEKARARAEAYKVETRP